MAAVEVSQRAADWLRDVDADTRTRIEAKLRDAGEHPEFYLSRLQGYLGSFYKLRIGDYRAIIDWRKNEDVLFVREIGHRDSIYD